MTATISADGFLEIPAVFRKEDALKPGQQCDIERIGKGEYRVRVTSDETTPKQSWLDILRACPVKDWYEPAEKVPTTDDLKPVRFE